MSLNTISKRTRRKYHQEIALLHEQNLNHHHLIVDEISISMCQLTVYYFMVNKSKVELRLLRQLLSLL